MSQTLHRPPSRQVVISIRLGEAEVAAINRMVDLTGERASDIVRYGAMHYIHRELKERGGAAA